MPKPRVLFLVIEVEWVNRLPGCGSIVYETRDMGSSFAALFDFLGEEAVWWVFLQEAADLRPGQPD